MSDFLKCGFEAFLTRPPSVIADVGTFDGQLAFELKRRYPRARVLAFEACPDNYASLVRNSQALIGRRVEVVHAAVCDHANGVEFYSNRDTSLGGIAGMSGSILPPTEKMAVDYPNLSFCKPRRVASVRLDGLGLAELDILHIDAQGAEASVLRGLGPLRPQVIYLEINETKEHGHYAGAAPLAELTDLLASLGYSKQWGSDADVLYALSGNVASVKLA